jgi:dolichyl-phosphate beta-glucosyltransferase
MSPLGDWFFARLTEASPRPWMRSAVYVILFFGLFSILWNVRNQMKAVDYRLEATMWAEVGELLADERVVALTQDYGSRLEYWGLKTAATWPYVGDINYIDARGGAFFFDELFNEYSSKRDYFLVTDFDEFDRQSELKERLFNSYLIYAEGNGYLIFDLSSSISWELLVNPKNKGKGFSIRRGVMESQGQYIIFIDADLPYELGAIDDFLKALKKGYDLAVGSRVLPGSEVRGVPAYRYIAGQIFSLMVQVVLFSGLPDTQCGFKSFRSEAAREIFRRTNIDGFGFDVEMLFVARKLNLDIRPIAVRMIEHRQRSRVRLLNDSIKMFSNLFMIRWMNWRGKYD